MCTILVAWRCVPGAPLIVAANRDELLSRPTSGPAVLDGGPPPIAGGQDLVAGGTWMAVAADGRVAAVTNRHLGSRDPARRTRGELPVLVLRSADPIALLDGLDEAVYNPANVLLVSPDQCVVRSLAPDRDGLAWLGPGPHIVTTVDPDDDGNAKAARLGGLLGAAVDAGGGGAAVLARMETLLADHGPDGGRGLDAACIHLDEYGTRSSSSVLVDADGRVSYRFAPGPPCVTRRDDVSALVAVPAAS